MLFLGAPSIYLSIKAPKYIPKTAIYSLIASVPAILVVDYIGQKTSQWVIPASISSIRLFGVTQIEQLLWAFFNFYAVVIFYKYFLDNYCSKRLVGKRWLELLYIGILLAVPFALFLVIKPEVLNIPYFYFYFGLVLIGIPAVLELFKHPRLVSKFLKTAAYFYYLSLVFEVTALRLNCCWEFPSKQFIGWIYIAQVRFPLEELLFWIMLFALAILAVYEKFDENEI